ncbi:NUDIX domain-containing protein [Micromonospora endolithica]|uniref:NUDIX domain-containing protein n=1 Tax=Micromonospora endolithica TaxID=230091 RepID=A0A3A9ZJG3_9ACTN|nr:NUDIX domain-containing protein [Micromonospora endolithica]RKN48463.1 NUDIX domain-containing protein [Micromonospora endolithica]TWJ24455.1 ADP-ribose pyrophosphatase YjhB (NUDIX family) [Micromonospora endolithica]
MSISWAESYVGQLRALAGDRTLMFVGARAVVRNTAGRVLLIRRSDNGQWALPAGAMELGESIADCAVREVREETGLRALRVSAFALYTGPDRTSTNMYGHTYQIFTTAFQVEEWDGELLRVTDETIDAGFFPRHQLPGPLSASVPETLADLDVFEQTNRLLLK